MTTDKALRYVSLARKANLVELGEEPVGTATRMHRARLVIVAADASAHTWHRAQGFVAGTGQHCIQVPFSKEQLGAAVGRSSLALAAFADPALALAFVKALDAPQQYEAIAADLAMRSNRVKQRRQEKKARRKGPANGPRTDRKKS